MNFFWSPFPTKRSAKTPQKIQGKIRSKIQGNIRDEDSKKFGELSFCDFSDLKKRHKVQRGRGFFFSHARARRPHCSSEVQKKQAG